MTVKNLICLLIHAALFFITHFFKWLLLKSLVFFFV